LNMMVRPVILGGPLDLLGGIAAMMQRLEDEAGNFGADPGWARAEGAWLQAALQAFYTQPVPAVRDVQVPLQFDVAGTTVEGWVDRIDRDGDGPIVVDHKLVATKHWGADGTWDAEWLAERLPQLALYAAGLARIRPDDGPWNRGRLVVCYGHRRLKAPQWNAVDVELTAEAQAQALDDVQTAQALADSGVYHPTPGPQCGWCGVADPCRRVLALTAPSLGQMAGVLP
ncbi:MAG: PD-(D/E)XK nuclease family protein, partial [Trebonia sp.]